MSFLNEVNKLLGVEGGYSSNKDDSGKETNWGITIATARAYGYQGPMKDLPRSLAIEIYKKKYWDIISLDLIDPIAPSIAHKLFDIAVNISPSFAAKCLQRLLNVFNRQQLDYRDIVVDGSIGPATIKALSDFLNTRGREGENVLYYALITLQGNHYINVAEAREKDESFIYGWVKNRVAA